MIEEKSDFKYWAFISYSHRDEAFCSWLHKKLDSYKTPASLVGELANDGIHTVPAKLYPIFRDREELPAGANLTEAITDALKDSRYLIVICSPQSAASKWVNQEIEYFAKDLKREKYILPIIVNGEPNSTDPQKPECFPLALRAPKEPLAADARKGKDGRDAALMKLRAGLLGVGLEDLVNRELKRQKKQVMWYALLAVFMLLLVVFSWFKQQEADANEKRAEHNYGLALAEKADRAFAENRINDGQIYAAHALARIDGERDKDAEITYLSILSLHLEKTGIPVSMLKGHESSVNSIHFSPDGKILASGSGSILRSRDNTVRLWDVASGKPIATLTGHEGVVDTVSFSPDGKTLASGSWDNTVRLWDVASGKTIATLKGHESSVKSVNFSPDGKTLASGSWDKTVRLWDVASGKPIATLKGHENWVNSVSFSPDGKTLASGSEDKTVRLWDVASGKSIAMLKGHEDLVLSVNFSPDGKTLASGSWDKTVRLWDVASGKSIATLKGHESSVFSVNFSPDGKTLASGNGDNTVRLWDVASGKPIATLKGHEDSVHSVNFSPDGKTLASGSWDNTVRLWDVASGKSIPPVKPIERDKTLSPDGKIRASIDEKDRSVIHLSDTASDKPLATLKGHEGLVLSVHFSPDGKTLASVGDDDTVRLWDVASGKSIATLKGYESLVLSVNFSPDGKTLASGSWDNTVRLWDVASGKAIATLKGHEDSVRSVSFSPDGKTLASGSYDKTVRLWDVASGKSIATLRGHKYSVESVSFSPDGKTLASGSLDQMVRLWPLNDLSIRDWAAQAAKDEKRYGLKLEGMKLVPIQPDKQ